MTVETIDGGSLDDVQEWMKSDEGRVLQRRLEENIIQFLFNQEGYSFLQIAAQLAWLGSRPENRPALARDVIQLKISLDHSIEPCKFHLRKGWDKFTDFLSENKKAILVGIAIVVAAIAASYLTGDPLTIVVNGVAIAGSGSIFASREEEFSPPTPNFSESEIAAIQKALQQPVEEPKTLPAPTEIVRTPEGIWANGYFYTYEWLNHTDFAEQFAALYPSIALPPPSPKLPLRHFCHGAQVRSPSHGVQKTAHPVSPSSARVFSRRSPYRGQPKICPPRYKHTFRKFLMGVYWMDERDWQHI